MGGFNTQLTLKKLQARRLSAEQDLQEAATRALLNVREFGVTAGQNIEQAYARATQEIGRVAPWAAGGVAGAVGAVVTPVAAGPILAMVGFSVTGPVAGTLAASIQAGIGSVAAGSPFALAQSIAMGGAAVPFWGVILGGVIAGGAVLVAALLIRKYIRYRRARARQAALVVADKSKKE